MAKHVVYGEFGWPGPVASCLCCSAMLGPGRQRNSEQGLFPVSGPTIGGGLMARAIFWIFFEVNSLVLRRKRETLILKVFLFEIFLCVVAL